MSEIDIVDVVAGYRGNRVLDGASLHVPEGTLACVLGPSGCGKTTLLRVLAGFEPAWGGTVRIGDTVVEDQGHRLPAEKRRVGYVPQEGAMFPHLTVAQNVGFGLPRGRAARDERAARVAELLELVGLPELGDRYPHQLSGGQQQRIAVARALARRPDVVLLDEPFASLDASLRSRLRVEIREVLRKARATAILVTHDRSEALSLADTVAVMRHGRIVQAAAPRELYLHPVDAGVAEFAGDATLLEAAVADGTADTLLGRLHVVDRGAGASTATRVAVRPEQLELGQATADGVRGRVVRVEFYGHEARVDVAVSGGDGEPPLVVVARVPGQDAPAEGEVVGVRVTTPVWPLP